MVERLMKSCARKTFICVTCPQGCRLEATLDGDQVVAIEGQGCKRGWDYVRQEHVDPRRMLTTTVRVRGGALRLLPVRSAAPLPKGALFKALEALRKVEMEAPVRLGQAVLKDVVGTGIEIVASREVAAQD